MTYPLWATPERQRILEVLQANLFAGRCTYGHDDCPVIVKVRQAILERIGLPDEDNPWLWVSRAALVVTEMTAEPPPPPPPLPLPIIIHNRQVIRPPVKNKFTGGGIVPEPRPKAPLPKGVLTRDELRHLPQWFSNDLKEYWKVDDRDARSYLHKLNQRWMHAMPGIYHRGRYDSIRKSEEAAKRPLWNIVEMGVSAFTAGRVAKVYIPSCKATIWVDLQGIKAPSRNQKQKYYRYGHGEAPQSIGEQIQDRCAQAVKRFLETPY